MPCITSTRVETGRVPSSMKAALSGASLDASLTTALRAARLMLPTSQRSHPTRWGSHKDLAAKAPRKLAGPHVPASLNKLEQAVKRAHGAPAKAERAHHEAQRAAREKITTAAAAVSERVDPAAENLVDELDETDAEQGEHGE